MSGKPSSFCENDFISRLSRTSKCSVQDKELGLREQALKKKDVEFQDHLCRFIRFLQVITTSLTASPQADALNVRKPWDSCAAC